MSLEQLKQFVDNSEWQNVYSLLIENGLDNLDISYSNDLLLFRAAEDAQTDIVNILLNSKRVSVNCIHDVVINDAYYHTLSKTPLMIACDHGNIGVIKLLLKVPDINIPENEEYCLNICASNGFIEIANLIVNHPSCSLNKNNYIDIHEIAKLFWTSCCYNRINMANFFLTLINETEYPHIINYNEYKINIEHTIQHMTPFTIACKFMHSKMIHYLLTFPFINISWSNNEALFQLIQSNNKDFIKKHINIILNHNNFKPDIATLHILEYSCLFNNTIIIEEYKKRFSNIIHIGIWQYLLKFSCNKNQLNICKWILENTPVDIRWNNFDTLKVACLTGNNSIIELLVKYGWKIYHPIQPNNFDSNNNNFFC